MVRPRGTKGAFYKLPRNFTQGTWDATSQIRSAPEIKSLIDTCANTHSILCLCNRVIRNVVWKVVVPSCALHLVQILSIIYRCLFHWIVSCYFQNWQLLFYVSSYVCKCLHCRSCTLLRFKKIKIILQVKALLINFQVVLMYAKLHLHPSCCSYSKWGTKAAAASGSVLSS